MEQSNQAEKELSFLERESIAREALNLALVKRRMEKEQPVNELVMELSSDLPVSLQKMLMSDYESMKQETDDENILRKAVEIAHCRIMSGYERKLNDEENIPNESFAMLNSMDKIDFLFAKGDPTMEDFKRVARVSFDLNGLKAVNDLNGGDHKKGDMYLTLAVKAITSPEAVAYAEKYGLDFDPHKVTRDGGDEFGVILSSEKVLDKKVLNGFVEVVQQQLYNNDDVSKILDFENPEVVARSVGSNIEEIKQKFGGNLEEFKKAKGVPPRYSYRGAISGGAATLYDGLIDVKFDPKSRVRTGDNYQRIIQKIAGSMFSSSDRVMAKNKEEIKKNLLLVKPEEVFKNLIAQGQDEGDAKLVAETEVANMRFLAQVYSRTEKEREQQELINNQNNKLIIYEKINSLNKDIKALYKAGAGQETIAAKEKDLEELEKKLAEYSE